MTKVLFVDDEADLWMGRFAAFKEFEFIVERDPSNALKRIRTVNPDVVLLDSLFRNAGGRYEARGREILGRIHAKYSQLPVVMFTATLQQEADESDFPEAEALFGKQMFEEAGGDPNTELASLLATVASRRSAQIDLDSRLRFVVGKTAAMRKVAQNILRVGPLATTVLIHGETGTGKELAARALHRESGRNGPLVTIDSGVPDDNSLESQLFGHEKGAFTDAREAYDGLFEQAQGGTLFFDEMPAMSPALQDKLVRAVETKRKRRMRGKSETKIDVRIIAATNRPLAELLGDGGFRHDLYERLSAIEIQLPPLRERLEDLPALYRVLVGKLNDELGRRFSIEPRDDVIAKLAAYSWPRNIRELEKELRAAMLRSRANLLTPSTIEVPRGRLNAAAIHPAQSSFDLAERILAKQAAWDEFKEVRGRYRREVLLKLICGLSRDLGREPMSKDIAARLETSDDNVRQIVKEYGGIRSLRQAARAQTN